MRKKLTVTIPSDEAWGRDQGKMFLIQEMPAAQAESWAMRAFLALAKADANIPDEVAQAGMAGVAEYGMKVFSGLKFEDAQPLLAEMFACIQLAPDREHPNVLRNLIDDDIEEVRTRIYLRGKVFELHTGFSLAAVGSTSNKAMSPAAVSNSPNTRTRHARSAQ